MEGKKDKRNKKKIILTSSIVVTLVCLIIGVAFVLNKQEEPLPVDKYVTSELINNLNTLEKDQMEELARKTLIVMSEKNISDSEAIKVETSGIMTVLTYNTSEEARNAYEKYSKDESILLCEYDKTVNVQHNEESNKEQTLEEALKNPSHQESIQGNNSLDDDILYYYDSVADIVVDSLQDTSNEKIYDKIIANIGKDDATKVPTIVVIDTGYNGKANYTYNVVDGSSDVSDIHGHGTSMVEIIKTQMGDIEYNLAIVKIANEKGLANTSYLVKAFEYIGTINPTVINMSFITTDEAQSDVLLSYVNKFSANGVAIVCSAGNLNDDASNYIPSRFDSAIVVGSCDEEGNKKDFSNYGSTVDINIVSNSTSEASAKVSSLYAIAYATNKNIADVLNDSKVVFSPNGGDFIKPMSSSSINEQTNENLWWWCGIIAVGDYLTNPGSWTYTDELKNCPISEIKYKNQISFAFDIQTTDAVNSTTLVTIKKGTYLAFGHNCFTKVYDAYEDVNGDVATNVVSVPYQNGTLDAKYYQNTSDEPTFVCISGKWYVAAGKGTTDGYASIDNGKMIKCAYHNNYSVWGGSCGWYDLSKMAQAASKTLTINPNGGTMYNGDNTTTSSFTTKFVYNQETYIGNLNSDNTFNPNNTPWRDGYKFIGWTFSSGTGGQNTDGSTFYFSTTGRYPITPSSTTSTWTFNGNSTSDVTATAQWEKLATDPKITVNGNGGTVVWNSTGVLLNGSKVFYLSPGKAYYYKASDGGNYSWDWDNVNANDTMPFTATRDGYVFNGFYTAASGGTCVLKDEKMQVSNTYFTKDTTIYAQWTKLTTYNIQFNINGGAGSVPSTITKQGTSTSVAMGDISSTVPTRTGYIFRGWSASSSYSNKRIAWSGNYGGGADKNGVSATTTSSSWSYANYCTNTGGNSSSTTLTLYAQWEPITYTIEYYNGSTKIGSSSHTYNTAKNLTTWSSLGSSVTNSSYGWTFAGWSTSSQSTSRNYTDGKSVNNLTSTDGNVIKLYAVYKRDVTFKHGVSAATTNTSTQYWNPYGTTNGTHLTSVTSPTLAAITNWSIGAPGGWRNDTKATSLQQSSGSTFYAPLNESNIYYGVYYRTIVFKSGVNAAITDSNPIQYLNSYNNTVSSITSGTPRTIVNWTVLGYRDDTTASSKEYASASSIAPAYNTGNTFYATYSRTLTIKYDGNGTTKFPTTGSVANTIKTIYMNAYSTSTSSQTVTLNANKFTRIGFKFTKWDIGNANSSYNPSLAFNHSTFVVTTKAMWEHDGSGVGTFVTPSLKVNNPNANGIYYNNGIYFVKGDGKTIVELYGEATLNPALITRIDKLSLNDGANMLTNPTYTETYNIEVPKDDVWNFVYNKSNVTNYNTHTGNFKAYGNPTIIDITQNKLSFTQKFTINGRVLEEQYIGVRASCMYEPCTHSDHTINVYGNSVRFHGDPYQPYAYIIDESSNKVSINEYDGKWTNQKKVTIEFKDDDSGIKYYKLTKGSTIVKEVTNASNTLTGSIILNLEEGAFSYTLYVIDNVGNEITYNFTPHVDRIAPSLTDLIDYKVMGNGNVTQNRNDVYTGSNNTNPWPTTRVDSIWEYNWQNLKDLLYKATDDRAGLRTVKITHYKQDSTYTTVWKSETLVNVEGDTLNATKEQLIESFNDSNFYLEGKSYLTIELEDLPGNKTTVKLVIRRDKHGAKISNMKITPVSLDSLTNEQLETIFASGDMSRFKTNVKFSVNENISSSDTSGIKKIEIIVKDAKTGDELKRYDVTNNLVVSNYTTESNSGNSRFSPLVRPLSGTINVNIDTLGEFPGHTHLNFYYEVTDYVGNITTVQDKSLVDGGNDGEIPNYDVKTNIYATKEKAYNIASTNGLTNMPYFKTGEVGYIEVWSIGYVDKLEIDFSDGNVGGEMNQAIANGQISSKYILGVHNGLPSQVRYVVDMSKFKVNTEYDDYNGVPYAAHISYTDNEVNNSSGNTGVDGWASKGTMIRIPPNYELVKKNKLDKYGNELFQWETHIANVYPIKNGELGNPSGSYYTIWDEAGDDLHFRITHQTFGY